MPRRSNLIQTPELREAGIVRRCRGFQNIVRLGVFQIRAGRELRHQLGRALRSGVVQQRAVRIAQLLDVIGVQQLGHACRGARLGRPQLDHNL